MLGGASDSWLWTAVARGARANALGEAGVQVLRLAGLVVLARALAPGDFGLFRVLRAVSAVAMLVTEAGVADALVQRRTLEPEHEAAGWWLTLAAAVAVGLILFAAAPLIATAMGMPFLTQSTRLLCLPIVLEGSAIVGSARLRRRLSFGPLAASEALAEAGFLATALILLHWNLPAWSLPGGLAARWAVHAGAIWIASAYAPHQIVQVSAARDISRFSMSALGAGCLRILSRNADYLLIGRLLGSSALGFYSMAWDLFQFVPDRLYSVIGRIALPAFSRIQDDDAVLSAAYRALIGHLSRLILPIAACLAVAASQLLVGLYGDRWLPAATPVRLLSLGLGTMGLRMAVGSVYFAKDHPSLEIWLQGARLLLIVISIPLLVRWGLFAVCVAMSAIEAAVSFTGQVLVCRLIGLRLSSLLGAILPGLKVAACCAIATAVAGAIVRSAHLAGAPALPVIVTLPALTFCLMEAGTARDTLRAEPVILRVSARS
jgi:PST family polysaccharide transporter